MIEVPVLTVGPGATALWHCSSPQGKLGEEPMRGEVRAANIYRREDGGWKIVHHHTDASPELQELLRRLQTQVGQTTG